jgi:hypothetical protein
VKRSLGLKPEELAMDSILIKKFEE